MALVLETFAGAETGGLQECSATATAPTAQNSVVHAPGAYAYKLATLDSISFSLLQTTRLNDYIAGAWIQISAAPLTGVMSLLGFTEGGAGGLPLADIGINSSGALLLRNANQTTVSSVSSPPITYGAWQLYELYFIGGVGGELHVFIDGVFVISFNGQDTEGGTTNVGGITCGADTFTGTAVFYVDDIYCYSGATSTSQRLSGAIVVSYRSNLNSATPDTGTALNTGVWLNTQEVPFSDTLSAIYSTSAVAGSVLTNDVGGSAGTGGPSTDTNMTGTIVGVKGVWRALRGGGGGTSHYGLLGNSVDGTTRSPDLLLTTSYAFYKMISELGTIVPLITEVGKIGFETSGAQDIQVADMLFQVLHRPNKAPPFAPRCYSMQSILRM